ncbi:YdeI/OmpD-associated family protein [Blastococcus mobilis]|uniref:Bacteriocin-protection, YdeI or OmpD-Associated n=1 Tax=Blastococcus mobilis TaxID=1938746 RepID=A0A238WK60_9ACTN|nr:YdeI/OmpD-associated family protein [Blastococcus mobilis]SNR46952.1 Bacteriocin-protection, YdeI or OmpD-Associated [Blastococcus mobilis]
MDFRATVVLGGKTATGIQVPDDVVTALGSSKRPSVVVTVGGHTYRTTVAPMGGSYWVPLAAEHREAAGVQADQQVDVSIELDTAPREVPLPDDLATAMDDAARTAFDALAYSHRKEWVPWVGEAKKLETRAARITKTVESLRAGKKTR